MKHLRKILLFLVFSLLVFFTFSGNKPSIRITSSKISYEKGDSIRYTLRIDNPTNQEITNLKTEITFPNPNPFSSATLSRGNFSTGTNFGMEQQLPSNDFLIENIIIPPDGYLEYYIDATLKPDTSAPVNVSSKITDMSQGGGTTLDSSDSSISLVNYNYNIAKISTSNTYDSGDTITYKITIVNNDSTMPITNFELSDTLSTITENGNPVFDMSQTTITSRITGTGDPGTNHATNGDLDFSGITLSPNSSIEYTITTKINSNINGVINNYATISDRNGGSIDAHSNPVTPITYDYSISKNSQTSYYDYGRYITYTIKVANNNPTYPLTGIKVEDLLSNVMAPTSSGSSKAFDMSTVSITANTNNNPINNAGTFNSIDQNLIATGVTIAPNSFITYEIRVRVNDDIRGDIVNQATITDKRNGSKNSTHTVNPVSYTYSVEKTSDSPTYNFDGTITYHVKVINTSPVPLTNFNITDSLSSITANGVNGSSVPAFDMSNIQITASKSGNSNVGVFNSSNSNLAVTGATIAPNSYVQYDIRAKVNPNAVGSIFNTAIATDRIGGSETSTPLEITKAPSAPTISKSIQRGTTYKPGEPIIYQIEVGNTGSGIAYNVPIEDLLGNIQVNLANDGTNNGADISGNPFSSVNIRIDRESGSTRSFSALAPSGSGTSTNPNLQDLATIYPGETLIYTITATTKPTAISPISNSSKIVNPENNQEITTPTVTSNPDTLVAITSPFITISKTTDQTEYSPGGTAEYEITVRNTDSNHYLNNFNIVDTLTNIMTTQIGNTQGQAFKDWILSVKSQSGAGTSPGSFPYGSPTTQNINLITDIGPGGSVTYKVVATVQDTSIGTIVDSTSTAPDNVTETGTGIKMFRQQLDIQKDIDSILYTPGQPITYTLNVFNRGSGTALNIRVQDILSGIETDLITGVRGPAYSSWTITGRPVDSLGNPITPNTGTTTGISGTISTDLDTTVTILPDEGIQYTIVAIANPLAMGTIINKAIVDNSIFAQRSSTTNIGEISVSKSTDTPNLPSNSNIITYTIRVENHATAGWALNIPVKDAISNIQAQLLSGNPKTPDTDLVNPFNSWEITAQKPDNQPSGAQSFPSNNDLNDIVNIPPGGAVIYTIKATLKDDVGPIYGPLTNSVTAANQNASTTTTPKMPRLEIQKTSNTQVFAPGQKIQYTITVRNTGDGYANNAEIEDLISEIRASNGELAFSDWNIIAQTSGTGTSSSLPNNGVGKTDINGIVDIAPNGSVIYTIDATVAPNAAGSITNTAQIRDIQHNNLYTASSTIADQNTNNTVSIVKTSETLDYTPGGTHKYQITVTNGSPNPVNLFVVDEFSSITGNLANLDGTSTVDVQGRIFNEWTIKKDGNQLSSGTSDLNDAILNLAPGAHVTYDIEAKVSPKALENKIKNTATIYENNNGNRGNSLGTSSVDNNLGPHDGSITRTVSRSQYDPGHDQITYTINVVANNLAYYNNVNIQELISSISVPLIDGTQGNPFVNPDTGALSFTVTKDVSNVKPGSSGLQTIIAKDNTDITGLIDLAPSSRITFTVTGLVRKDASGTINYQGNSTAPYLPNISISKTVNKEVYIPGQFITYSLEIKNKSNANIPHYHVIDEIMDVKVKDSSGNTVPAFTEVRYLSPTLVGYKANPGTMINNQNLDTYADIPAQGSVTYNIEAKVSQAAIGTILNSFFVENDSTANELNPSNSKLSLSKSIVAYYDTDGVTVLNGGYKPGGYIEYAIALNNLGNGIADNIAFSDFISKIETTYFDGSVGKAFDSWTITLYGRDNNPITTIESSSIQNDKDIDTLVDIAPNGFAYFKIKAKINEKVIGPITNQAEFGGTSKTISSNTLPANISHTKQVFDSTGTHAITHFSPGDTIVYKIRVENRGKGISADKIFQDMINNISASVSENGTNGNNPKENPFSSWNVVATTSGGNVTNLNGYAGGNNDNINLTHVSIAPGGWINFEITATIKDTVLGNFTNTSIYDTDHKNRNLVVNPGNVSATKTLTKLNGELFTNGMQYKPGDLVEYKINVQNSGQGFANDIHIVDNLSTISSDLTGHITGSVFENINITTVTTDNRTHLRSTPTTGDISTYADISPLGSIDFTITANIKNTVLGTIPSNTVTVGNTSHTSSTITPKSPNMETTKTVISPIDKIYVPGETVTYLITIKNIGEGYAHNYSIKDPLSDIKTELVGGIQGNAFTSWKITRNIAEGNGITNISSTSDNSNINILDADIAPGATVTYTIEATINPKAIGDITNRVTVGNKTTYSEPITLKDTTISLLKTTINSNDKYSSKGNIGYDISITNTGNSTAKNILLTDEISKITTLLSGGTTGRALQGGWTYSHSFSGTGASNSFIGTTSNGSDLNNLRVDLAKGTTLTVSIRGTAVANSMGDILNTASTSYLGNSLSSSVTLKPELGNITTSKRIGDSTYGPGLSSTYNISITNNGPGFAKNVAFTDEILNIKTTSIDGTQIPAFTSFSVSSITASSANTHIYHSPGATSTGYSDKADIAPGDTVTLTINAIVNKDAVGAITNTLNTTYLSQLITKDVVSTMKPSDLDIQMTVDKKVYASQDTLTYQITVTNSGLGSAVGTNIKNDILGIMTDFIGGGNSQALDIIQITRQIGTGTIITLPNANIDDTVSIPSITQTGENKVVYTITTQVRAGAVGEIRNHASVNSLDSNEVISNPMIADLSISKTSTNTEYAPDGTVTYDINIENKKNTPANNISVSDLLSGITALDSSGNDVAAFKEWKVVSITSKNNNPVNLVSTPSIGSTSTSDISISGDIAANDTITVRIEATVNPTIVGSITNIAELTYNNKTNTSAKTLESELPKLSSVKTISKINNNNYSAGDNYIPGKTVEYEILIKNSGDGFSNSINVTDYLSHLSVEVTDNNHEQAYSQWVIDTISSDNRTIITTIPTNNHDINTNIILAPNSSVTFKIVASVNKRALGIIGENTVSVTGLPDSKSPSLNPGTPTLSVLKEIISGNPFIPGGEIEYRISIKNSSNYYANDISIKDILSDITAETILNGANSKVFSSWDIDTIHSVDTVLNKSFPNEENIDVIADIAPKDTLVFNIFAKLNNNIVGDITNTVNVSNANDSSVTSKLQTTNIIVTKEILNSDKYYPGGNIGFKITLKNPTNILADNVHIKDDISTILTEHTDGTQKPAFEPGWTISTNIIGDTVNTNVSNIPTSGNIDSFISIGANTEITIEILGKASSTAIGDIINLGNWEYNGNSTDIIATITPEDGNISIVKSVSSSLYEIGRPITYTLTVTNSGPGYARNVNVSDLISTIETEFSNSVSKGSAFASWKIKSINIDSNSNIVNNLSNGVESILNIYPNKSVVIEIEALPNNNAVGDITNIASAEYKGNISSSSVTVTPGTPDISITKTVDKSIYFPGDTITYTVTVKNNGHNWATGVSIIDNLNDIQTDVLGGYLEKAFMFNPNNSLNTTIDIAPRKEITFTLSGIVTNDAVGTIENTAVANFNNKDYYSETVVTKPTPSYITLSKESNLTQYVPGQNIIYTIKLKNQTQNNINGVVLKDFMKQILVEEYDGTLMPAFDSWTITYSASNPLTSIRTGTIPNNNQNIDAIIDIAGNDEIVFTIDAKVSIKASGELINTASSSYLNQSLVSSNSTTSVPYSLGIEMKQTSSEYVPGGEIQYNIVITNNSPTPAIDINLQHILEATLSTDVTGNLGRIFSRWNVTVSEITNDGYTNISNFTDSKDLLNALTMGPNSKIVLTVRGNVNPDLVGDITLNSKLINPNNSETLNSNTITFRSAKPNIVITKESEVIKDDLNIEREIIYTITLKNSGSGNNPKVHLIDEISKILSENNKIAFTSWTVNAIETGEIKNNNLAVSNNQDINKTLILKNNNLNTITYKITGTLNKEAYGKISNTAYANDAFGNAVNASAEDIIKDSRSKLNVYKKAMKDTVKIGDIVEYEVIVENTSELGYENIILVDRIPSGFKYQVKSAIMTLSGVDGTFGNKDDISYSSDPVLVGNELSFSPVTLRANEKLRVRYLLKASIGITFGKYTNTAYATSNNMTVSNIAKATVTVTGDPLLDTASIIGKVFHDLNGDFYQNNPEANNVAVKFNLLNNAYIPGTATLDLNGIKTVISDEKLLSKYGTIIEKIQGIDTKLKKQKNKAILRFQSSSDKFNSLQLKTTDGTAIQIDENGKEKIEISLDVKLGMNTQNLHLTQNVYRSKTNSNLYTHELIIENKAVYENGIPGVRVVTFDGIVAETDSYGRFHLPEEWVFNKKGSNYLVKVDETTLPKGMVITSENPYLRRITAQQLNRYNFSAQMKGSGK